MRNKSQTHVGNVWQLLVAMAIMLLPVTAFSQEVKNRHAVEGHRYLKEYWGQPELYLQHQAYYMLDLADKALNENPPQANVNLDREMALLMIDAVTHEPAPKDNPAVKDFLAKRMNRVIEDLGKPFKNKKGLRVYKLYNCGMLFRTRDMTIAVDLNGRNGMLISDDVMEKIVDKIDILFYTHNHSDHADNHVREICHKKHVPIYATDEIFAADAAVHHVRYNDLHTFGIEHSKGTVSVNVLPGHQSEVQNNIWIVTMPNGKVVGATGDQWKEEKADLKWLRDIHTRLPKIDVLAMDCWIHDYDEHVDAFQPRVLITQHENEIGAHGIDHREAYWMTMYKNKHFHKSTTPYVIMAWGEWYDYK